MKFRYALLLASVAAFLQVLSFPPFNFYWLAFVFAVPLFIFLAKERRLPVLLAVFFAYRIFVSIGIVYFVFDPIMFFFSDVIFLGVPLGFWLARKVNNRLAFLLLPFFWTFFDYLESRYTALPSFVMMAGNAMGNSPFLGIASLWGIISLTFFILLVNLLVFAAVYKIIWRKNRRHAMMIAAAAIIIVFAGWIASRTFLLSNGKRYESLPDSARVVLVSENGNLDEVFKDKNLDSVSLARAVGDALAVLEGKLRGENFDLLVLPEAMIDVNYDMSTDQEAFSKFGISNSGILIAGYRKLAKDLKVNLAANMTVFRDGKRYNTILFFDRNGNIVDVFYKKYLTITGEYWPFGNWRPFYYNWIFEDEPGKFNDYAIFNPKNNFSSGQTKVARVGALVLAPAVCLEIHYPAEMERRVDLGADMILDTSSNLWLSFGLDHYLDLTDNLRRIESVWLNVPISVDGRMEPPLLVLPNGKTIGQIPGKGTGDYEIFPITIKFDKK